MQYTAGDDAPLLGARVGAEAARHFGLGYDAESDAVTYPLRKPSGELVGVVRRPVQPGEGPKYLYPRNVDIGHCLFNYDGDGTDVVVLVEGALDAIAFWNIGVEAWAIYGSRFSEHQLLLIDRVDPTYVVTAFDNDEAGFACALRDGADLQAPLRGALALPRLLGQGRGRDRANQSEKGCGCSCISCGHVYRLRYMPRPSTVAAYLGSART